MFDLTHPRTTPSLLVFVRQWDCAAIVLHQLELPTLPEECLPCVDVVGVPLKGRALLTRQGGTVGVDVHPPLVAMWCRRRRDAYAARTQHRPLVSRACPVASGIGRSRAPTPSP
jgi:hypothetical protein